MPIIIGLGTGRSGTQSLARLLNNQPGTVCFHETNPSCVKWAETPRTIRSMIDEFQTILAEGPREITIDYTRPAGDEGLRRLREVESVTTIGDVAFYYLSYASMLLEMEADIRMPCIQRDRDGVVSSFARAVRIPVPPQKRLGAFGWLATQRSDVARRNHWVNHDGSRWRLDPKWDSLFPKFDASELEEAIGKYWDFYTAATARLTSAHPDKVRVFDIDALNSEQGQRAILEFCGVDEPFSLGKALSLIHI